MEFNWVVNENRVRMYVAHLLLTLSLLDAEYTVLLWGSQFQD